MKGWTTTQNFIANGKIPVSSPSGFTVRTEGYYNQGDGGGSHWAYTGNTITPSQSPSDLGEPRLSNNQGYEFILVSSSFDVKEVGAVGDGITDDTLPLQAAVRGKSPHSQGGVFFLRSRVIMDTSGTELSGAFEILADTTSFDRTDGVFDSIDGTVLLVSASDVTLRGATIRPDSTTNDRITTTPLAVRDADRVKIIDCTIFNFAKSIGLRVDSSVNSEFRDNKIHDFFTDDVISGGQLTGISMDDNRVGAEPSFGCIVSGNRIYNINVGANFEALYGYQTDGINIQHPTSSSHSVTDNIITNVGEGIDCFGQACNISQNVLNNCLSAGVKIVNGGSYNIIANNVVKSPRSYGVGVFGSQTVGLPAEGNLFASNLVYDVNPNNDSLTTSYGVGTEDNSGASLPSGNTFVNNQVYDSPNANFAINAGSSVDTNIFTDTRVRGTFASGEVNDVSDSFISTADKAYTSVSPNAQVIPNGVATVVEFANVITDSQGEFNAGSYEYVSKTKRRVVVTARLRHGADNVNSKYDLVIRVNGSELVRFQKSTSSTGDFSIQTSEPLNLNEGDSVSVVLTQNTGGNITLTSAAEFSKLVIAEVV